MQSLFSEYIEKVCTCYYISSYIFILLLTIISARCLVSDGCNIDNEGVNLGIAYIKSRGWYGDNIT